MKQEVVKSTVPLSDYMFSKACNAGIPLSGTFELSPLCNFACRMCYVRKTAKEVAAHSRSMMTLEQWLDIAHQARKKGMLFLLLTGGEPFLWPDFWKLYEELIRMGFLVSINTNGSMIDEAAIRRLRKMPPKRINITLYGASDAAYERLCCAKGIFSRVDGAITGLKKAGIQVKLNCSLTPDNICDLKEMIAYAEKQLLILDTVTYMFPPVRRNPAMTGKNERFSPKEAAQYRLNIYRLQNSREQYIAYLKDILNGCVSPPGLDENCIDPTDGKIRCRAGKACFWVTWDGWMTPCGMMPEPKIDLQKQMFDEAWTALMDVSSEQVLSGVCAKCPNQKLCHSCAAMAYAETGSISGIPAYLCETVDELRRQARDALEAELC